MLICELVQVALVIAIAAAAASPPSPHAEASRDLTLVRKVQAHHQTVKDLTARFTQTYSSGLLGREVVERGKVMVKRPDRMLWQYEEPEKKTFVSNGKTAYFY